MTAHVTLGVLPGFTILLQTVRSFCRGRRSSASSALASSAPLASLAPAVPGGRFYSGLWRLLALRAFVGIVALLMAVVALDGAEVWRRRPRGLLLLLRVTAATAIPASVIPRGRVVLDRTRKRGGLNATLLSASPVELIALQHILSIRRNHAMVILPMIRAPA